MYLPKHFAEDDVAEMRALMRAHPLATLVSHGADGLNANHIPLLLADALPWGRLQGHVARKRFGQNFLHDENIIRRIVQIFAPVPGQRVVEIGPGLSLLPSPTIEREVRGGTLAQVPLKATAFVRPLGLVRRRGRPLSAAVRLTLAELRRDARAQ
jgi:DNA-binding transcriptional LysR family regulator